MPAVARLLVSLPVFGALVGAIPAQWTCVRLHPAGSASSQANATADAWQGGTAAVNSALHAAIWNGTAASWVDLHPAALASSQVLAMAPGVQVGVAGQRAAVWHGTAASYVNLDPTGAAGSAIRGTDGYLHVGNIRVGIQDHACTWTGTSTPIDLHTLLLPAAVSSYALSTYGGQVAGYFNTASAAHAVVWSSGSYTDLTPATATGALCYGVDNGEQVGYAVVSSTIRACLWHGSASSWTDLHPTGHMESKGAATFGGFQVGYTRPTSISRHAAIWTGTAASFVDLHAFAPATMTETFASAIWSDGVTLYVAGRGNDSLLGSQSAALLWSRPLGASTLATNATLGQGCGSLQLDATTRPLLGSNWGLAATGAPTTTTFGVTWLATTDPGIADLAFAGLPGCPLRADLAVLFGPWLPVNGASTLTVALPASPPSLLGLHLYAQAAAFAVPAPNPFGAITSNGLVGTLGDH